MLGSVPVSNVAATEADFPRSKAREAKFAHANERRVTQRRGKSAPSLRAAPKISPYGVAAFAKVVHIGCMLRLVWRNFEQQRGSRLKRGQTLSFGRQA
ncbi:hypothetical protein AXE65_07930 [Ventosimonas gracilis]|uniref:Uncharacterized protein n=1 Tax=Ventosimonas gracilis TaxID=1680762 RepID=A0A139SH89_9GAMM|nr:hypothetical protein AXE65_07930 [Ventosimonas gracilis]